MKPVARLPFVLGFAGATLVASQASAHVRFVYPTPRYPTPSPDNDNRIKSAPCGVMGDTRTTDMSRITVLQPGATIMVQFNETVPHPGHFRIAFDDDGQNAFVTPLMRSQVQTGPTFTLPVLLDNIADQGGMGINAYMVSVTLPNVQCERCTLQLIQVMETGASWLADDIYYTCADIALRGTGGMGGAGGMSGAGAGGVAGGGPGGGSGVGGLPQGGVGGVGGVGGASAGVSGVGITGGAAPTGGVGGSPAGGTAGTPAGGGVPGGSGAPASGAPSGGTPPTPVAIPPATEEVGGCSMVPTRSGGHPLAALGLALFGMLVRRRRGSRSAAA